MSEEEKKAIDMLNYIKNKTPFIFWYGRKPYNRKETIETILNLVEKQQNKLLEYEKQLDLDYVEKNYISKDKIREKMQEIMNYTYSSAEERHNQNYAYDRLQELLED